MHPVTFSVQRIHWSVLRRFRGFVREHIDDELTPGRFEVLRVVKAFERHGFVLQARIARVFGVVKSSTSRILKALERLGFISRVRADEDRRFKLVMLTDRGREVIARFVCAYVGRDYQDVFENAFLHSNVQPPDYAHLYRQFSATRIALDDNAPFLHPWTDRPLVEEKPDPGGSARPSIGEVVLRVDDVDDRIDDLESFDMD